MLGIPLPSMKRPSTFDRTAADQVLCRVSIDSYLFSAESCAKLRRLPSSRLGGPFHACCGRSSVERRPAIHTPRPLYLDGVLARRSDSQAARRVLHPVGPRRGGLLRSRGRLLACADLVPTLRLQVL